MNFDQVIMAGRTWVPGSAASHDFRNRLIVRSRFGVIIPLFTEKQGWIGLPRFALTIESDNIRDNRQLGSPISYAIKSGFRPGQSEFVEDFKTSVFDGKSGFLIQAPTAAGKTFLGIWMIRIIGKTALVVVNKSDLVDQWQKELLKHTDLNESEIGTGIGGQIDWRGKKIVIALVHTLALDRFGSNFKKYFGTVLFDEADRSVPPQTFAPVAGMFPAHYRIAMSATLKRRDGLHVVIEKHFGETKLYAVPGKKIPSTVLMHFHSWNFNPPPDHLDLMVRRAIYLKQITKDFARNKLIAQYTSFFLNGDRRVIVFADHTKQLVIVKEILEKHFKVPPADIGFYTRSIRIGNKSKAVPLKERERTKKFCKVLLATYGMLRTGTDMPEVSGIVFASPQSEATQTLGRIERFKEGKKRPIVVDIVDTNSDMALSWASQREMEYRRRRLIVKKIGGTQWTQQSIKKSITGGKSASSH